MDYFLYNNGLRHERVEALIKLKKINIILESYLHIRISRKFCRKKACFYNLTSQVVFSIKQII